VRGHRPTRTYYNRDEVAFSEFAPGRGLAYECLVAGTPVWTEAGAVSVEQIEIGDRVLSQHPETGELTYKSVLRTTECPPEHLVKLQVNGESIQCSGGHPFWVSGNGWVKARHLQPDALLHTVIGVHRVESVEHTGFEATYNLMVADFHTYFVGARKILTHENTIRVPTDAVVPGLIEP